MQETEKQKAIKAYHSGSEETKKVLIDIFGDVFSHTPTLDDYTTIKTYEDACEALGEKPVLNGSLEIFHNGYKLMDMPPHIIALMKLETISRALWGRTWKPKPDAEGTEGFNFLPVFVLYTQSEISNMDEEKRAFFLTAFVGDGAYAGFGSLYTGCRSSYSASSSGFRLCQENYEKAEYFGKQFIELWAEYLQFGFQVEQK